MSRNYYPGSEVTHGVEMLTEGIEKFFEPGCRIVGVPFVDWVSGRQ